MKNTPKRHELIGKARQLRKNPTFAEAKLWKHLRRRQVMNKKFRRQHILTPYIVDFYCVSEKLAVEVDGPVHNSEHARDYDEKRTKFLEENFGITILRFTASQVLQKTGDVLHKIEEAIGEVESSAS